MSVFISRAQLCSLLPPVSFCYPGRHVVLQLYHAGVRSISSGEVGDLSAERITLPIVEVVLSAFCCVVCISSCELYR